MHKKARRVAIIGAEPAALRTAERLVRAGMCVDLITSQTAPLGLLSRFAGLSGVAECAGRCPAGTTPLLRLIGNVTVGDGPGADITVREFHALAADADRDLVILELKARGVPVTTWEGVCAQSLSGVEPADWDEIAVAARRVPICV